MTVGTLSISSKAFSHRDKIPMKYTGEGADISPPLTLSGIPTEAKSLVLVVDDPDAPRGTFDHWIAWNIPPETTMLEEGADVPFEGKNHFGETRYRGPLPPPGPAHRYFFKIFALDTLLELPQGSTKEEVMEAIEGHVIAHTELIGMYQR